MMDGDGVSVCVLCVWGRWDVRVARGGTTGRRATRRC